MVGDTKLCIRDVFFWVENDGLIRVLNAYWDDSDGGGAIAVAGYVAEACHWEGFDDEWNRLIDPLPYLHMKEVGKNARRGPFEKVSDEFLKELFSTLPQVMRNSKLVGAGAVIPDSALRRFQNDSGLELPRLALAMFASQFAISRAVGGKEVSVVFDKAHDAKRCAALAEGWFERAFPDRMPVQISALSKKSEIEARNCPPLQAADWLAWELRINYVNKMGFYEKDPAPQPGDRGLSNKLFWWFVKDRMEEARRRDRAFDIPIPMEPHRRSFIALDMATPIVADIFTYETLMRTYEEGVFTV